MDHVSHTDDFLRAAAAVMRPAFEKHYVANPDETPNPEACRVGMRTVARKGRPPRC